MVKGKLVLNKGTLKLGGSMTVDELEAHGGEIKSKAKHNWTEGNTVTTLGGPDVSLLDRFKLKLMRLWLPRQWRLEYIKPRPLTVEEIVKREINLVLQEAVVKLEEKLEDLELDIESVRKSPKRKPKK